MALESLVLVRHLICRLFSFCLNLSLDFPCSCPVFPLKLFRILVSASVSPRPRTLPVSSLQPGYHYPSSPLNLPPPSPPSLFDSVSHCPPRPAPPSRVSPHLSRAHAAPPPTVNLSPVPVPSGRRGSHSSHLSYHHPVILVSGRGLCPTISVSRVSPPPRPDRPGVPPIARLSHLLVSVCRSAPPAPLRSPSQFPGDVARALALHSGGPLPAARRTSLAQMQRPWPQSGWGGCWQRLCSRREAEEGGLGTRWGRQDSGVTGAKVPPKTRPCTPHFSASLASVAVSALEGAPPEGHLERRPFLLHLPCPGRSGRPLGLTPPGSALARPPRPPAPHPPTFGPPSPRAWATSPLPAVATGAGAGAWLGAVEVPDGACPLTSPEAVGLPRGPRLAEVCGAAGVPTALLWRMIPDGT